MKALQHYLSLHLNNCRGAWVDLRAQPVATGLTVVVIGIALALPSGLHLLVQNGRNLVGGWESVRDFSVYLKTGTDFDEASKLADELAANDLVISVSVISADDALDQFRMASGFSDVLESLDGNPLPHTLVARPADTASAESLAGLEQELLEKPEVDLVRIDTKWVARLNAILDFLRRSVWIAAVMLIGAAVMTVGNTIRLDIQNRRDEIEISKLLGASDGFVRRPFLYIGLWYGMVGGVVALLLIGLGLLLISALAMWVRQMIRTGLSDSSIPCSSAS